MIYILAAISIFILTFVLIQFSNRYQILENYSGEEHQKYTSFKNIPKLDFAHIPQYETEREQEVQEVKFSNHSVPNLKNKMLMKIKYLKRMQYVT